MYQHRETIKSNTTVYTQAIQKTFRGKEIWLHMKNADIHFLLTRLKLALKLIRQILFPDQDAIRK